MAPAITPKSSTTSAPSRANRSEKSESPTRTANSSATPARTASSPQLDRTKLSSEAQTTSTPAPASNALLQGLQSNFSAPTATPASAPATPNAATAPASATAATPEAASARRGEPSPQGPGYQDRLGGVLLVPGLNAGPESMQSVANHLTSGGQNQFGGILDANKLKDLTPEQLSRMSDAELRQHLGLSEQGNIFSMRFSGTNNTMEQNAAELARASEVISRLTNDPAIDIVAHSKGGLDARQYLGNPGEKVDNLITLGSPHAGSGIATVNNVLPWSPSNLWGVDGTGGAAELSPRHPAHQALTAATAQQNEAAKIHTIGSTGDWVTGSRDSQLPGANNYVTNGGGHGEMLQDRGVQQMIGDILAGRRPTPNLPSARLSDSPFQGAA